MAGALLVLGQLYLAIPLTSAVVARFAASPEEASLVGAAFGATYALGFLVFGPLSDRIGRRLVITGGLVALAATTILVGLAQTFETLIAARALQGLSAAAFAPTALSLIAEALEPQERPLGLSLMSLAFLGAAPLAQLAGTAAADVGLSGIMLWLAPAYVLAAGALGLALGERGGRPAAVSGRADDSGGLSALLRDRLLLAAWAAAGTVLLGFVTFFAGAALRPGVDAQTLALLRLAAIPPLFLTFAAAPLAKRIGPHRTAALGLAVSAAGLLMAATGGSAALVPASVVLAGGVSIAVPGLIGTVSSRAGAGNRGLALALYSTTLFLGASAAQPLAHALAPFGAATLGLVPALVGTAAAFALLRAGAAPGHSSPAHGHAR
ncbi:major facilitator superfamily protein [Salinarimonas ramus]|uniref:Major facilitator superfamily protein n=2 Tax=Salinarimonas ramus TaxID=690164 RepID=A0A917QCF2_9HYPH|nr:major facilitator superfamily protein [Salinarimonas ramus]